MVSRSGANGPIWVRPSLSAPTRGKCPVVGTRPAVGLKPSTPHHAAGSRMLPPESLPMPSRDAPAATATASPELDPPGVRPASAVRTAPPGAPSSHDGSWPRRPHPRRAARDDRGVDRRPAPDRTTALARREALDVDPVLTVTGRPCSGPSGRPSARARSRHERPPARSSSNAAIAAVTSSRCAAGPGVATTSSTDTSPARTTQLAGVEGGRRPSSSSARPAMIAVR
jgi:hypothetical protein